MEWNTLPKPAEIAESRLIDAILNGDFPIMSNLPAERELANRLGVTRPTLREALQRLARDGWIEIHHGKPTRVCDYWSEGNLGVLGALALRPDDLPASFIFNLLEVRQALAPAYAGLATARQPGRLVEYLHAAKDLPEDPSAFAAFDWVLHRQMACLSGNPIFTLILNGFKEIYPVLAERYFTSPAAQVRSRYFYGALSQAAEAADALAAETITRQVMVESTMLWKDLHEQDI